MRAAAAVALALLAASCGARTGLDDEPYASPGLVCQGSLYRARPNVALTLYAGLPRPRAGSARWTVLRAPDGAAPPRLADAGGETATFTAAAEGPYDVRVSVPAAADGGADASCVSHVVVRAEGPAVQCPDDVTTAPLREVRITALAQTDRPVDRQTWTLVSAPASSARPPLRPSDRATTAFTPDVAGAYVLRFDAVDAAGLAGSCVTTVRAVPREGLRVELSWDPPGRACPAGPGAACDESDVDLHLLAGSGRALGFGTASDCYYFNCNASASLHLPWGAAGAADDPRLDLDDVSGHGPENVNIDAPGARSYRVGVHYFEDHGAGSQSATATIYCGGAEPAARLGPVTLSFRGTAAESDFWVAADVLPRPGGGCDVRPIARGASPWIVSWAEARRASGPPAP